MYTKVLILYLLTSLHSIYCQQLSTLQLVARMLSTSLPFSESKIVSSKETYKSYGFKADTADVISIKSYGDLNLSASTSEQNALMFRKFEINQSFYLLSIEVGEADWVTRYLVTMSNSGNLIDCIESGVLFYTLGTIAIKQYGISSDKKITVYYLNVTSPSNVDPFNFTSVTAQRIDKVYQIDATGHFSLIQQKNYVPKSYSKSDLEDNSKDLWSGNETLQ